MKFKIHSQQEVNAVLKFIKTTIYSYLNKAKVVSLSNKKALFFTAINYEILILEKETEYDFPIAIGNDGMLIFYILSDLTFQEMLTDLPKLSNHLKNSIDEMRDSELVHEITHHLDIRNHVFTKKEIDKYAGEDDIIETFKTVNMVEINAFLNEITFLNDFHEFDSFDEVVSIVLNSEYDALGKEKLVTMNEFKNTIQQVFDFPMADIFPNIK